MFSLDLWIKRYDITIVCKTKNKTEKKRGGIWRQWGLNLGMLSKETGSKATALHCFSLYVSGSEFS